MSIEEFLNSPERPFRNNYSATLEANAAEIASLKARITELEAKALVSVAEQTDDLNAKLATLLVGAARDRARIQHLSDALIKIIEMNRQQAEDQYGYPDKAETWSCVKVAREALEGKKD